MWVVNVVKEAVQDQSLERWLHMQRHSHGWGGYSFVAMKASLLGDLLGDSAFLRLGLRQARASVSRSGRIASLGTSAATSWDPWRRCQLPRRHSSVAFDVVFSSTQHAGDIFTPTASISSAQGHRTIELI